MTDEALAGGAPAPAEPVATPEAEPVSPPQPLGTQTPVAPKPEPVEPEKPAKTAGDALRKANEAIKAKAEAKPAEKAPAKAVEPKPTPPNKTEPEKIDPPARRDDGTFAPKEQPLEGDQAGRESNPPRKEEHSPDPSSPYREAPARFSPDAKTAWETAPEPVKAEVHRAIKELEQGHQKYKASHEAYESVREFDELARKNGGNLRTSLEKVVELETAFTRSPIEGFQKVADHFGIPLRAVAAHIMGQKPEEVQTQQDQTIRTLKSEIDQLKQQVGTVSKTFEEQRTTATMSQVEAFAKEHPRFEELAEDIEFFLKSGRTKDLSEAYTLAERLNPAPAASAPAPVIPAPAPVPLNPAGQKSVSGAPSSGSDPTTRKPPASSPRQALERAFGRPG